MSSCSERERPWVLLGMDKWPIIGRWVRNDLDRFIRGQQIYPKPSQIVQKKEIKSASEGK